MTVWQVSFNLVLDLYKMTKTFPDDEKFGLISDIRRAANSIPHNIAEGFDRYEKRDKTRFYKIARGSAFELQSQLMVSHGLKYIKKDVETILIEKTKIIIKEINAMIKVLETQPQPLSQPR